MPSCPVLQAGPPDEVTATAEVGCKYKTERQRVGEEPSGATRPWSEHRFMPKNDAQRSQEQPLAPFHGSLVTSPIVLVLIQQRI